MTSDLPVYSPTETEDYLVCPRYRVLKRAWVPRGAPWTPHMLLGTAVHAGLAASYQSSGVPLEVTAASVCEGYVEGSEWSLEGLIKLATKGLTAGLATELVSPQGSIVAVEENWPGSHCRIDLVTREPFGLVVTDHKVSLDLDKRKLDYKIRDLDPSWQLLHYAWAVWQHYGEVPAWSRAHIIAIGPRPFTHIHSIQITQEKLLDWAESAETHWGIMSHDSLQLEVAADILPPMNTRSCWRYGRKCEFYDGCHVFAGDLTKFPTLYDPIVEGA